MVPTPSNRKAWRLPLHIPVAVLFSLLILGVGSLITLNHFRETRLLLEAANDALFRTLADKAREAVSGANGAVRRSFILLSVSSLADASNFAERLRFLPELSGLLEADPLVSSIMVGYGNGDFFEVSRAPGASGAAWHVLDISTGNRPGGAATAQLSRYDVRLRLVDVRPQALHFEPRTSAWYRDAALHDGLVVTPAGPLPFRSERGVTFARRNGAEVFAVNVGFANLSRLLSGMPTTAGTHLSVVGRGGQVLAAARGDGRPPNDLPPSLLPGAQEGNGSFTRIQAADGRPWRVSRAALDGFGDEGWTLLLETPEDELLADAYRLREASIRFTLLAVLLSFPLAWALSRLLTTPLHRLAHLARALSSLQFQQRTDTHSLILEVDQLGGAMAMMRAAIARFLEMGRDLGSARDVDSVLAEVVACAQEISGAGWGGVAVKDAPLAGHGGGADRQELLSLADAIAEADGPASLLATLRNLPGTHVLGIPLHTPDGENLGTLLLADHRANHHRLARPEVTGFLVALAGTAAVALENQRLLKGRKDLLHGVISMVAEAIDAKSPYTGGHCRRVTAVARRLAIAAHNSQDAPFLSYRLDATGWEALEIAGWLHDCGKLTTPEYVIDKATKLETLYNRIHEIRTRFEVLKRDAEIAYWRGLAQGGAESGLRAVRDREWRSLDEDFAFVAACNVGGETMPEEDSKRLERIAGRRWTRSLDNRLGLSHVELARYRNVPPVPLPADEALLIDAAEMIVPRNNRQLFEPDNPWGFAMDVPERLYNHGELYNLQIQRGTLNEEERFKIKEHIVQTIVMLSRLPFPSDLAAVPEMASAHHETMDGRGYPRRLDATQMSVTARIMAIADIFEALTAQDRPYRRPNTAAEAIALMEGFCARRMIDPDLFALFVAAEVWREDAPPSGTTP